MKINAKELIMEMMKDNGMIEEIPVFMMKDHPGLEQMHKDYILDQKIVEDQLKKLADQHKENKENFFRQFETAIKEKGLVSQEMFHKSCGQKVEKGVYWLKVEKKKD